MKNIDSLIVITPKNDPESLLITRLCEALSIPHLISAQPHGAVLSAEPRLEERIKETHASAKTIIIIEIPGTEEEEQLRRAGYRVEIIDHHRYDTGLDRMKKESSLEQLLTFLDISNEDLKGAGFDPLLVRGVGVIDRSFVWGLYEGHYMPEDRVRITDHYLDLLSELDGGQYKRAEEVAKEALRTAHEVHGFLVVRNPKPGARIREALSFELARTYPAPKPMVLLDADVIYVQESVRAKDLYTLFGGFMYGGEERCWGKKTSDRGVKRAVLEELGMKDEELL